MVTFSTNSFFPPKFGFFPKDKEFVTKYIPFLF
jgi:hypothetical protein